jgi:membrane protease YdiL (CAAX protease family)
MSPRARRLAILSPFALIGACHGLQHLAGGALGVWAWVPTLLFFWGAIAALTVACVGRAGVRRWWQPARGGRAWTALAILMGLLSLPQFLRHASVLETPHVAVLWLVFAAVNPWFEEGYWRGLLLDATAGWNGVLSALYASSLFAVSHPLVWGVHSLPQRHPEVLPVLLVVGLVWSTAYKRTGSLRGSVVGHACANLLGLAVPVLLNLHDPVARVP